MDKRIITISFLLVVMGSFALRGAEKPNIVLVLADDLGIGDVNCYGGDRCLIETPNLDRLAFEGMRFTDAHVNASICTPTRRALMTGRLNWRFGPTIGSGPWGFVGPRPGTDSYTLAKLLGRADYHTGYVGKWHLGTLMTTTDGKVQGPSNVDYSKPLVHGPRNFGFDESFILPGSLDMFPYAFVRNHQWLGDISAQKGWSAFNRVGPAAVDFEDHEVLETFYREAEKYILGRKKGEPFFLFLSLTAPHTPISPGARWQGKSDLGLYGDFVMEVDHAVERVMTALRNSGFDENTLVLFSSDHGPASYAGNIRRSTPNQIEKLEAAGHYPGGPYRGYKFSIYEGGLRVPLIARWPRVIKPGQQNDSLVGLCDLMATFAELTGVSVEEDEAPDSISFADLLKDSSGEGKRNTLIMRSVVAFAFRDGPWKLCLCPGSGTVARSETAAGNDPMPEVAWRRALDEFGGVPGHGDLLKAPFVQLFNLDEDPHEDHNLAAKHPERVKVMVAKLRQQVERGRSTPGPALKNDKRIPLVNIKDRRLPDFVRSLQP